MRDPKRRLPRTTTRRQFIKYTGAGFLGVGLGASFLRRARADTPVPVDTGPLRDINADMVSDGYPENRREQGQSQVHHYPNNEYQRPATLWYHDHSVHITSVHLYRGLAGFYIITDEEEDATGLPGTLSADPGRG